MPDFPDPADVPQTTEFSTSIQFVDHRGKKRSAGVVHGAATPAEVNAFRASLGNASNAAVIAVDSSAVTKVLNISNPNFVVFDEAYSSSDHVAVFVFQDDTGDMKTIELPAPDLSIFYPTDGETVDPLNALAANIILNGAKLLNSDGAGAYPGTYAYVRGFLSTRSNSRRRQRQVPKITEPDTGDQPGQAPGLVPNP